ncbi:MAG: DUF397 domain-containing protein [Streptosporangiaceae bacterium]
MQPFMPARPDDLSWRIARLCNAGSCVRVAASGDTILIGDSKSPDGPVLAYTQSEWLTFVEGVKQGDFDNLT